MRLSSVADADHAATCLDLWEAEIVDAIYELQRCNPDEANRDKLLALVSQLFSLLPVQFDLKARGDAFREAAQSCPGCAADVSALRLEEAFLYEGLRDILEQLRRDDSETSAAAVRPAVDAWLDRLEIYQETDRRLTLIATSLATVERVLSHDLTCSVQGVSEDVR